MTATLKQRKLGTSWEGGILIVTVGLYDGLERDGESGQVRDTFWKLSQGLC